jgi:hypothetical protein
LKNIQIKKYQKEHYHIWNQFIADSKNGTFLFHRDFMEYHKDRFEDFSLLVFESDKLIAILPANVVDDMIYSHQGLTYGGLVFKHIKLIKVIEIFKSILLYLETNSFKKINLKCIPSIYHKKPSEELQYVMFLLGAELVRRDSLSVIDLERDFEIARDRKAGVKRGEKNNLIIEETDDFNEFWETILIPNLSNKHNVIPVHTLKEIEELKKKFPLNIRQFNVYFNDNIVAGTTIFESDKVAHSQYISANGMKNELGSLDFLHYYLFTNVFREKKYFDFGTSNENSGKKMNSGLSYWKESFGASTVVQDFYEVSTSNYKLLANVLL